MSRNGTILWRFVVLVGLVMMSVARSAQGAFTQATCVTSGWDTGVPARIGATEYIKQSTSPPGGSGDMTLYNLATAEHWPLYANTNVSFLKGSFGYFVTETFYDALTVKQSNGTVYSYSGTKNWRSPDFPDRLLV